MAAALACYTAIEVPEAIFSDQPVARHIPALLAQAGFQVYRLPASSARPALAHP